MYSVYVHKTDSVCDQFYDLLCSYSAEELIDPLCGGSKPRKHDLSMMQDMRRLLDNVSHELRRRESYIYQQETLRRNKLLDSFIRIKGIQSHKQRDWQYPDDDQCEYACNIHLGPQLIYQEVAKTLRLCRCW